MKMAQCWIFVFLLLFDVSWGVIILSHYKALKFPGEDFMVTCKDEAGRVVAWSGPRGNLGPKTHPRVEISSFGTSLVFMPIAKDDGGTYRCRVGQDDVAFDLTVQTPLTFMDTSPVQMGREGTNVTLRCEVKGDSQVSISWSSENFPLEAPKFTQIADGLLIRNASRDDAKVYTCRAMQVNSGSVRDQQIALKIEHQPYPKHPPLWAKQEEAWGFLGGFVNLTCEVIAEPPPRFEWYKKGHKVIGKDGAIFNEPHKSVLRLLVNNTLVFGDYKCKASNPLGTLEKLFTLQQGTQPPPPESVKIEEIASDLVNLKIKGPSMENVTFPVGMDPLGFRVQYRTKLEETKWEHANAVDFPNREDHLYVVTELKPKTQYDLRVATRNRAGVSEFTTTMTFETLNGSKSLCPIFTVIALLLTVTTL